MRLEDPGEHHMRLGRFGRVRRLGHQLLVDADRLRHVVELEPVHVGGAPERRGPDARRLGSLGPLHGVEREAILAQRGLRLSPVHLLAGAREVLGPGGGARRAQSDQQR